MEGRLQGDSRPSGRPALRLSLVAAALAASAVVGAVEVLPRVENSIARDTRLTAADRRHAAGDRLHLRRAPFDAFSARLEPRQRFAVDVPRGRREQFATRGDVVRAYSAYFFLPAIEVRNAPVVFHYRFR